MTCHIAVFRHRITGVVSLGHFDNFCCWQFGEESSAHKDGIEIMVQEMAFLSCGNCDNIEVTVVGGYTDVRGDAAKNSLSLLRSLHDHWCVLNLKHFCVGKYNTTTREEDGCNTAILRGISVDLSTQELFPAIYDWGQYEDFKTQIQVKFRNKHDDDDKESTATKRITADSTFKPKSLKNQARAVQHMSSSSKTDDATATSSKYDTANSKNNEFTQVKLKPTKPLLGLLTPSWCSSTTGSGSGGPTLNKSRGSKAMSSKDDTANSIRSLKSVVHKSSLQNRVANNEFTEVKLKPTKPLLGLLTTSWCSSTTGSGSGSQTLNKSRGSKAKKKSTREQ
jgi:hypothetical protein